jgi:hypothetical protein
LFVCAQSLVHELFKWMVISADISNKFVFHLLVTIQKIVHDYTHNKTCIHFRKHTLGLCRQ